MGSDLREEQAGFLQFIGDLSAGQLRSTYLSYHFLADFGRADEIWKRDACAREFIRRKMPIPETGDNIDWAARFAAEFRD